MTSLKNTTALLLCHNIEEKYNVGNFHFYFTLANRFGRHHFYGPGHELYNESTPLKDLIRSIGPQVIFFMLPGRDLERGTHLARFDYSPFRNILKVMYDTDSQRCIEAKCRFVDDNGIDYLILGNNYRYIGEHEKLIKTPCRVMWQPFGVDTGFFADRMAIRPGDVLFVGNTKRHDHYPDRVHMVGVMSRVFGDGFHLGRGVNLIAYMDLLNRYKIFVSAGDVSGGFLMKNLEAMACGCLLITQHNACFERLGFVHGKHLLLWETFRELVDLTRHYLGDYDARTRIAREGRRLVADRHTWNDRVDRLLEKLGWGNDEKGVSS